MKRRVLTSNLNKEKEQEKKSNDKKESERKKKRARERKKRKKRSGRNFGAGERRVMTDINTPQIALADEPKGSKSPLLQTKKSSGNIQMNGPEPKTPEKTIELAVETMEFQRMHYTKFLRYSKGFTDAMTSAGAELSKLSNAFKDYSDSLTNTEDPLISLVSKQRKRPSLHA